MQQLERLEQIAQTVYLLSLAFMVGVIVSVAIAEKELQRKDGTSKVKRWRFDIDKLKKDGKYEIIQPETTGA